MIFTLVCVTLFCYLRLQTTKNFPVFGVLLPLFLPLGLDFVSLLTLMLQMAPHQSLTIAWSSDLLLGLISMSAVITLFLMKTDTDEKSFEEEDVRLFNKMLAKERQAEEPELGDNALEKGFLTQENTPVQPKSLQEMIKSSKRS